MNARQYKKQLKNKIRLLTRDNDLMRDIIANHPQMQETYDAWTKPLHAIVGTIDFQQYMAKRHISPYDPCDMEIYKRELINTMVETIKNNIEFEVDTECGYPILTARIYIGRRRVNDAGGSN